MALSIATFSGFVFADCNQKINSMNDGISIRSAMNCIYMEQQKNISFPSKAVVAFNSESCPNGWETLKNGEGRVIVGAGRGDGLSARILGDIGGAEVHTLTISEIPSHHHSTIQMIGDNKVDGVDSAVTESGEHHNQNRPTGDTGGNGAHNNMQPFVVLKLCEKK